TSGTGSAQSKARASLIANVQSDTPSSPTPLYLSTYAGQLDDQIKNVLENKPNMSVRLNAGIVVAEVAARAETSQLSRATKILMQDKSDPVALWGMRAARHGLPFVLDDPFLLKTNSLLGAIVPETIKHPNLGAIADEAYGALTLGMPSRKAPKPEV